MKKILFIHYGPHPVHESFVKPLNPNFLPFNFGSDWNWHSPLHKVIHGVVSSALFLPKNFDIYLCEDSFLIPVISKKLYRLENKIIINIVDSPLVYNLSFGFIGKVRGKLIMNSLQEVDGFICVGKMEAELLRKLIKKKPYVVVKPFIRNDLYSKLKSCDPDLETSNILFVARGPNWFYKGLDLLIDSFQIAKREYENLTLSIVGEWQPKKEWLVDGVNFVGFQENIIPWIERSSLYAHTGRGEAFGVDVLETMLGGLPALVSKWTGAREVIQNLDHNLISELSPLDIANKILRYFDLNSKRKRKLSKKAKNIGSNFKEDESIELFRRRFHELLDTIR